MSYVGDYNVLILIDKKGPIYFRRVQVKEDPPPMCSKHIMDGEKELYFWDRKRGSGRIYIVASDMPKDVMIKELNELRGNK